MVGLTAPCFSCEGYQGSNSIEGYEAGLDDAVDVAAGEEPLDADEETSLALRGYRDAMTYVLQMAEDEGGSPYSAQLLKSLHFMMTSYSLNNRPGRWRASSIYIRNDETGEVVYEEPDIDQVPTLIDELVASLIEGPRRNLSPIINAGMAHLNLVMIHPFRDGNGRMARCLQSLVLAGDGVLSPVFMSHLRQARTMLRRVSESERTWLELERLVSMRRLPERTIMALFDATIGLRVRNATYRSYFEYCTHQTK